MAENMNMDQGPDQHGASEQKPQKQMLFLDQLSDELRRLTQEHFASMDRSIQNSLRRCLLSHFSSSACQASQTLPGRVDDEIAAAPATDPKEEVGQARNSVQAWSGMSGDLHQAGLPRLLDGLSHIPPNPEAPATLVARDMPPMLPSTEPAVMRHDAEQVASSDDGRCDSTMQHNDCKRDLFTQVLPAEGTGVQRMSIDSACSRDPRFMTKRSDRKSVAFVARRSGRNSIQDEHQDESSKKKSMFAALSKLMGSNVSSQAKGSTSSRNSHRRASLFTSDTKRLALQARHTFPQRIVSNKFWTVFSFGLIISNSVLVGWQTQAMAERALDDIRNGHDLRVREPIGFTVAQILFTLLFTFELTMRWLAEGLRDFWLVETGWNLLDFMVVVLGWIDVLMLIVTAGDQQQSGSLMTFRVMRVLRIIRIGNIIRMINFFRELRMMISSILASFKSLGWVCMILIIMFYMFGISFTAGVTDNLVSRNAQQVAESEDMVIYFGTLGRSILTLFKSMTGGEDWRVFHDALEPLPFFYRHLFLVFITFAILAVFNIVTGVFVESAMASSQQDREAMVQDEIEAKKTYFKAMETLFEEMDEDDSGTITLEEFESRLDDERVAAYFNSLKLDVSDAKMLFQLLDHDGSEEISYSEFVSGCQRLQGEATSLDAKVMQYEVKYLKNQMDYVIGFLDQLPKGAPLGGAPLGGREQATDSTLQQAPQRLARSRTRELAQALAVVRRPGQSSG